jgi:hypothetical protein
VNWFSTSVQVPRLSDLTVKQWLQEFDRLMTRDKQFRKGIMVKKRKSSARNLSGPLLSCAPRMRWRSSEQRRAYGLADRVIRVLEN